MSPLFRTKFVLMCLGEYAYGDHVKDERAFGMRLRVVLEAMHQRRVRSMLGW